MLTVEVDVAARELERLVDDLKSGRADGFIITRDGVPWVRLLPIANQDSIDD